MSDVERLRDDDPDVRIRAIRRLARSNDKEAVPLLIEMLDDSDEEVLEYTCRALGKTKDERVVLPLIKFIQNTKSNEEYIDSAILALGHVADERAVDLLIEMLGNSERRLSSAKALGTMRTEKSLEALIGVLQSENAEERNIAISGLYRNIKYEDKYYEKVLEICSDIERRTTEASTLLDLINRDAGIHPDGSVAFSEAPPAIIEPKKEVFYRPELQEWFYIDEDGNEVECDNAGRDLN